MPDSQPQPSSAPSPSPGAPPVAKLAAKVAHELNNPLDAVLRLVSLAQRKNKSGDYADVDRHLVDAQFGLQRMAEILRELMDIGRQSHEIAGRAPAPLGEIILHAVRAIGGDAELKHVKITFDFAHPEEAVTPRDSRLAQVLSNLLKNALDAAPENSAIHIRAARADGLLTLTVRDHGPGIDPAILPKLFTPFATTKPRGKGHGLGLVISRDLMVSLGGTLALENAHPGCVATLQLPA